MIMGIGIDLVEVERFADYAKRSDQLLGRLFTPDEIIYCKSLPALSAQRFAARFAAKEATLKALAASAASGRRLSLFTISRAAEIKKDADGKPTLQIDWKALTPFLAYRVPEAHQVIAHLSLTHTLSTAGAVVILEKALK